MSDTNPLSKYNKAQEDFINDILEFARKKDFTIVIATKHMYTTSHFAFAGDVTVMHGLIHDLGLEADVRYVKNIKERIVNENAKPVGTGNSPVREGEGMVGTPENAP